MAIPEAFRQPVRTPHILLARCRCRADRMACTRGIPARHAIGYVAFHRTRLLPRDRPPFLVARHSAVAVGRTMAAVVDAPVSLSRHASVRRPVRPTCFFGSRRVPHVSLYAANGRPLCSPRSTVRCSAHVDLRHHYLPRRWNDSLDANAVTPERDNLGMNHIAQTLSMVISFWDYVALLPTLIVASVVLSLIRRKE
jgi:hypothetical protein